tara:strand:+ start:18493 stop:19806 length:1314 start_codon:yes stop_codon:yes gene_type:complete
MSTGLFQDEEDGYNIEETKFKLKVDNPNADVPPLPASGGEDLGLDDMGGEDLGGLDDMGGEEGGEKPFDDQPFDAGIEADETTDPEKFIQQLSGKLGTSLRKYSDERGEPDFDLEKFAVNSVISATHTSQMDDGDQKDIISKVKGSGAGDDMGDEMGGEPSPEEPVDDLEIPGEEPMGDVPMDDIEEEAPLRKDNPSYFDRNLSPEEEAEEAEYEKSKEHMAGMFTEDTELPLNHNPNDYAEDDTKRFYNAHVTRKSDGMVGKVLRAEKGKLKVGIIDGEHKGKYFMAHPSDLKLNEGLNSPKKSAIFVENMMPIIKRTIAELNNSETAPIVKPTVDPVETPSPRRKRIWEVKPEVEPRPKAEAETNSNDLPFNGKMVEYGSIDLDDVHTWDYPDFTDAYIASANYTDGIDLTEEECELFQDEYNDEIHQMAYESLF